MEITKEYSATSYDSWDKLRNPNEQNSERDRGLTDARAKRIGEAVKMADAMAVAISLLKKSAIISTTLATETWISLILFMPTNR